YEPGLEELLGAGLDAGRVKFTTSYPEAAAFGDVHFICTGTPQQLGSNRADLSQVHACVAALAPLLDRPCLVVGKSTVPVGTARRLAAELSQACPGAELAWNPEFLREGNAVADTLAPDRIFVGVTSRRAGQVLRPLYAAPPAGPGRYSGSCTRGRSRAAPRSSPPAWKPPSWPRRPPTHSWPRRSRSST